MFFAPLIHGGKGRGREKLGDEDPTTSVKQ